MNENPSQPPQVTQPVLPTNQMPINQQQYVAPPVAPVPSHHKKVLIAAIAGSVIVLIVFAIGLSASSKKHSTNTDQGSGDSFSSVQQKSTDVRAKADIRSLQTHLEAYYNDNGYYPGELTVASFGSSGSTLDPEILNAPAGYKYVYTPTPAKCTTASQTCQTYNLKAVKASDNSTFYSVSSLN